MMSNIIDETRLYATVGILPSSRIQMKEPNPFSHNYLPPPCGWLPYINNPINISAELHYNLNFIFFFLLTLLLSAPHKQTFTLLMLIYNRLLYQYLKC